MQRIRLACVPEQVNIPVFHLADRGLGDCNVQLDVQVVPEGTGRMVQMLEDGTVDVAITVTDALLVAQSQAARDAPLDLLERGGSLRVGVSREGSGSHSMARYMAWLRTKTQGSHLQLSFHVAHTFQGLRDGVNAGLFDIFLWETFTSQPYIDKGEIVKVDEVSGPWPAFSFAVSAAPTNPLLRGSPSVLHTLLFPRLQAECEQLLAQRAASAQEMAAPPFLLDARLALRWMEGVRYGGVACSGATDGQDINRGCVEAKAEAYAAKSMRVDAQQLALALRTLSDVGILGDATKSAGLLSPLAVLAD